MDAFAALIYFLFDQDSKAHPAPPLMDTLRKLLSSRKQRPADPITSPSFLHESAECAKIQENNAPENHEERKSSHG